MRNQFVPLCAWPAFIFFISSSRIIASIPPSSTHVRWAKANTYQAHACIFIDCARHLCWQPNYEEEQETQRNSTPQAGNCVSVRGGRGSEKDIKREKSESWQLCQQLINLQSCLLQRDTACRTYVRAHTHTALQLIIIRLCTQYALCFSLSWRSLEREECPHQSGTMILHHPATFHSWTAHLQVCKVVFMWDSMRVPQC